MKTRNRQSKHEDILGISPKMLSMMCQHSSTLELITNTFNHWISHDEFPSRLKISKIVPVPKKTVPTSPSDFKPISVQTNISKLYEKCLFNQLSSHLKKNNMISKYQFGLRRAHSTTHACIALSDLIYEALDKNHVCFVVALDVAKAFDRVDRKILLQKLAWYGIDSKLIQSFLHDRRQLVKLVLENKELSSSVKATLLGVTQGFSLSNLLFILMVNDLPLVLRHSSPSMFADDNNLFFSCPMSQVSEMLEKIKHEIMQCTSWMSSNNASLNIEKTELLIIARPHNLSKLRNIELIINGKHINRVSSLRILGVVFDESLSWSVYTKKVIKSCNSAFYSILPYKSTLSLDSRKIFVNSLIMSHIIYA